MMTLSATDAPLRSMIQEGRFFELPLDFLLNLIQQEYACELDRLKSAYSIATKVDDSPQNPSPSMKLYGVEFDEINRTLVGVMALRWIYNGEYTTFVGTQPVGVRLSYPSFHWLQEFFSRGITTGGDLYALITSMIINDLGKSPTLARDFQRITQVDISHLNHDLILYRVVDQEPSLIPSLSRLPPGHREDLVRGIQLGSKLNFGQLAQAECAPASLAGMLIIKGHTRSFEMRFMEQILDVSGALGHADHSHAMKLTEPVFQAYKSVHEGTTGIMDGRLLIQDGYDLILARKVDFLVQNGWDHKLDASDPEQKAVMRLLCLSNAVDSEGAELVWHAFFDALCENTRHILIHGLNVFGSPQQPAVQATYLPAVCSAAIKNTETGSETERIRSLAAVFRYLARILVVSIDQAKSRLPHGVNVIERDVRETVLSVVNSARFRHDPSVLQQEDIPEDRAANIDVKYSWGTL